VLGTPWASEEDPGSRRVPRSAPRTKRHEHDGERDHDERNEQEDGPGRRGQDDPDRDDGTK